MEDDCEVVEHCLRSVFNSAQAAGEQFPDLFREPAHKHVEDREERECAYESQSGQIGYVRPAHPQEARLPELRLPQHNAQREERKSDGTDADGHHCGEAIECQWIIHEQSAEQRDGDTG